MVILLKAGGAIHNIAPPFSQIRKVSSGTLASVSTPTLHKNLPFLGSHENFILGVINAFAVDYYSYKLECRKLKSS